MTEEASAVGTELSSPAPKLTEAQLDFVMLITQHYLTFGEVPSADRCEEQYRLPAKLYKKWIDKTAVKAALIEQGVVFRAPTDDSPGSWRHTSLSAKQLIVANVMLDILDVRSDSKKLKDLGVTTNTYNAWKRDPAFANYLRERAEAMLGDNQHEAHLALLDKVRSGDIKAISYYNELVGRFTTQAAKNTSADAVTDAQQLLTAILEIILEEVDDVATSQRIAERFKTLMVARGTAAALINPEPQAIAVPEVVPTRSIEGW